MGIFSKEPNWTSIVEDLGPQLYRYFCGSFTNATASDLVQDTLIRLVNKYDDGHFNEQKGSMAAYAFGIARFVRLEARKSQNEFELTDDLEKLNTTSEVDYIQSEVSHLRWAINQLKPLEQEVILLMIDGELSLDEIGGILDVPVNTIKSHVHRAKDNLRQIMGVKNEL